MLRVAEHFTQTDTGRQRRTNEDALFVRSPLFVVADGMGGARGGEVASKTAVAVFENGLPDGPASPQERLALLAVEANERVHARAQEAAELDGMGTTLTAAYVGEQGVAVAHVGDSRMYCLRDGVLEQRTDDHSLVWQMEKEGQISRAEAERHPQRSIITRALGPEPRVEVDSHTWPARHGDVFLLCSDGLTSMVDDEQIAAVLRSAVTLEQAGQGLVGAANTAGGRDNITVLLFRLEEVGAVVPGLAAPPVAAGEAPPSTTAKRAPRLPPPATPAPPARRGTVLRVLIVSIIVIGVLGSAGWIASRSVYFVGASDEGFVALFQGLPYELPAGVSLHQQQFESGVSLATLPARVRATVTAHELRTHDDARDLLRQLERGGLATQR